MEMAVRRREQEIWHALDDLWAIHGDSKNLTGDAIRDRLVAMGKSRGSPNEIYKYRKTWVHSRGIRLHDGHAAEERTEDPISRAVHVVHEKLKEESLQQIDEIKKIYEQKLTLKEEELHQAHTSMRKLVSEYGELEHNRTKIMEERDTITQELHAETEIRKASERELSVVKLTLHHEQALHEKLMVELKGAYEHHVASLVAQAQQREQLALQERQELMTEKKLLGEQFSEQLNQLKLEIYNKDIVMKNHEQKIKELLTSVELLQINNDQLGQEKIRLTNELAHRRQEMQQIQLDKNKIMHECALLSRQLNKAQISVARLRAMLAYGKPG